MVDTTQAALGFAAVGAEPRIEVILALVRAGPDGLLISELQQRLGIPASTLAHHIRLLATAGLMVQERRGRTTICRPNFEVLEELAAFLLRECCIERNVAIENGSGDGPKVPSLNGCAQT